MVRTRLNSNVSWQEDSRHYICMHTILTISTLIGGGAALWFLYDKAASIYRGTNSREQLRADAVETSAGSPAAAQRFPAPATFVINGVYNTITLHVSEIGAPGHIKINGQYGKPVYEIQATTPIHIVFHGCYNTVWLPAAFRGPLQIEDNGPGNNVRRQVIPSWFQRMFGT